jgi:hypothetical protein
MRRDATVRVAVQVIARQFIAVLARRRGAEAGWAGERSGRSIARLHAAGREDQWRRMAGTTADHFPDAMMRLLVRSLGYTLGWAWFSVVATWLFVSPPHMRLRLDGEGEVRLTLLGNWVQTALVTAFALAFVLGVGAGGLGKARAPARASRVAWVVGGGREGGATPTRERCDTTATRPLLAR